MRTREQIMSGLYDFSIRTINQAEKEGIRIVKISSLIQHEIELKMLEVLIDLRDIIKKIEVKK